MVTGLHVHLDEFHRFSSFILNLAENRSAVNIPAPDYSFVFRPVCLLCERVIFRLCFVRHGVFVEEDEK